MITQEFLEMAAGKRADRLAAERGRYTIGRWTVDLTEYDPARFPARPADAPRWYALAHLTGHAYEMWSEAEFSGATREEVEARVREYLAPAEISLDPLDVGFDLRTTGTPVVVPASGEITVRFPRSKRHPSGRVLGPVTRGHARHEIKAAGFAVA